MTVYLKMFLTKVGGGGGLGEGVPCHTQAPGQDQTSWVSPLIKVKL